MLHSNKPVDLVGELEVRVAGDALELAADGLQVIGLSLLESRLLDRGPAPALQAMERLCLSGTNRQNAVTSSTPSSSLNVWSVAVTALRSARRGGISEGLERN